MTLNLANFLKQPIKLNLVIAMCDSNYGIALNGTIPWRLPEDMKHFVRVTTHTDDPKKMNAVLMDDFQWFSMHKTLRPLNKRLNIIVSPTLRLEDCDLRRDSDQRQVIICKTFDEAVYFVLTKYGDTVESMYSIGGEKNYKQALNYPAGFLNRIYLTRVYGDIPCDMFMEPRNFLDSFRRVTDINFEDKKRFQVEFNKELIEPLNGLRYSFEIYEKVA